MTPGRLRRGRRGSSARRHRAGDRATRRLRWLPATPASAPSRRCGGRFIAGSESGRPSIGTFQNPSRLKGGTSCRSQSALRPVHRLDAIGPYEVLSRLPDARVMFVGTEAGPYKTDNGMLTDPRRGLARRPPEPGDPLRARRFRHPRGDDDERLVSWIRARARDQRWTTSVCTGSLLLGAAGRARRTRRDEPLARARDPGARWARTRPSDGWSSRAR